MGNLSLSEKIGAILVLCLVGGFFFWWLTRAEKHVEDLDQEQQ